MKSNFIAFICILLCYSCFQYEICQIKQSNGNYESLSSCDNKNCEKSDCIQFKSVYNTNRDAEILYCKTNLNISTNFYEKLDLTKICNLESIFGCFNLDDNNVLRIKSLINVSCKKAYEFKQECNIVDSQIICDIPIHLQQELESYKFNVLNPLTVNDFDISLKNYNFLSKSIEISTKNTLNFDLNTMIKLIYHSRYAYNAAKIKKLDTKLKDEIIVRNDEKNLSATIGYDDELDSIIVSVRGTVFLSETFIPNVSNLFIDLNLSSINVDICSDCKVHSGFYESYKLLKSNILEAIKILKSKYNREIIFTGHSLGAAISTILATEFIEKENCSLVTFGSPRVGNVNFANYINLNLKGLNFRVTYRQDPVTKAPPKKEDGNFYHIGVQVFLESEDKYTISKDGFIDTANNVYIPIHIMDHTGYWKLIKNLK